MRYFIVTCTTLFFIGCGSESSSNEFNPYSNPLYFQTWHLNYSQDASYPSQVLKDSNMHLQNTWTKTRGAGIKVAIIDSSFEVAHKDLKDNIISTFNAINSSSDVSNTSTSPSHGHAVAGLIAGADNSTGTLGVAPEASLVLIKVNLSASDDVDILRAFDFAMSQEVDVINCSWGSYAMSDALEAKITQVVESGISVVFASGNENLSLDKEGIHDESEHPLVIGVSASNELNQKSSYSNYGSAISVMAPSGSRTLGVITTDESGAKGYNNGNYPFSNNYTYFYGTSASAPITSGAVALIKALNPELSPSQIKTRLQKNTDKVGDVIYDENGFNIFNAYGKINVDKSI